MSKPNKERIELAYRRVHGNPDKRTEDQQIVYDNMAWTAKQPAGTHANEFKTNCIVSNSAVSDYIWNHLALADKDPLEPEKETLIKTEDNGKHSSKKG